MTVARIQGNFIAQKPHALPQFDIDIKPFVLAAAPAGPQRFGGSLGSLEAALAFMRGRSASALRKNVEFNEAL